LNDAVGKVSHTYVLGRRGIGKSTFIDKSVSSGDYANAHIR